jgi:hypothetical protein
MITVVNRRLHQLPALLVKWRYFNSWPTFGSKHDGQPRLAVEPMQDGEC